MEHQQHSLDTPDSDTEDDPAKLLNHWLGELNTLKRGLDAGVRQPDSLNTEESKPVLRAQGVQEKLINKEQKQQYRCSLINLDNSQDDELDAILGELTVLESQFDQEIKDGDEKKSSGNSSGDSAVLSPASDRSSSQDLGIHSTTHSRSSSGSDENIKKDIGGSSIKNHNSSPHNPGHTGGRTDSPDTDSAFCDNLSVLSSCSTASSNKTGQSFEVPTSVSVQPVILSKEEQDAKLKAEKIKIAIEKIKEASVKKLFIKVFSCNGSAKSLLVDEKMTVGQVTRILAEKNHMSLDAKWALVELVPDLYMERVYEDHEFLVENCLLWKVDSKNTLWFIERPEKFDLFLRPEIYLLGSSSSQKDGPMEEHCRQELVEEYFSSSGVGAPQVEGFMWLKADSKKSWKKFYFILRTSGLYYASKGKKSSKDLICLTTFDVNQVYYGVGWHRKYKAPTEYCFGIKHPQIQAKNPKYIKYLCVDTQKELHQWVTGIRTAKNGRHLFDNYRGIVEEITHADIDILTAKRFSLNSSNDLKILANPDTSEKSNGRSSSDGARSESQILTPSSENKSLASALSSGIESDMSAVSSNFSKSKSSDQIPQLTSQSTGDGIVSSCGKVEHSATSTPKGTLERDFKLRRSFSRSSSSSGCMSDKSVAGEGCGGGFELGFESDFPVGGTIKKRPTTAARLPLTSTTWGLVRENDQDMLDSSLDTSDSMGSSDAGSLRGTLLRKAVKNSQQEKHQFGSEIGQIQTVNSDQKNTDDPLSSAFERSMSSMSETDEMIPLPPPPRVESVTSLDNIDLLPPPPPDMCYPPVDTVTYIHDQPSNHYHVSPVTSPVGHAKPFTPVDPPVTLPPPRPPSTKSALSHGNKGVAGMKAAPSTLKKAGGGPKPCRRISFDDNVQMIEVSPHSPSQYQPHQEVIDNKQQNIPKYCPPAPIRNHNPKKLSFVEEETKTDNYGSLPRSFLESLQKVMNKKWQVAEKCRVAEPGEQNTPHEVLGFRDEQLNSRATGQPNNYSKNSAIGAWILETQLYAHEPQYFEEDSQQQPNASVREHQQHHQQNQNHQNLHDQQFQLNQQQMDFPNIQNQHILPHVQQTHYSQIHPKQPVSQQYQVYNAQQKGQYIDVPEIESDYGHYDPVGYGQFYNQVSGQGQIQGHLPVVLREPEPTYVDPSRMRALKSNVRGGKPPPPPKRSLNTQLTNSNA